MFGWSVRNCAISIHMRARSTLRIPNLCIISKQNDAMKTEILLLEKGVFQVKCFFVSVLYKGKGTITWSWLGHFQPSSLSLVYLLTSWEPWSQLAQGGRGDQRVVNLALFGDKGCTWNCGNSGNFKENQYKFGSRIIILKSVAKCTFVVVETVFISVFIYFTPSSNIFFVPHIKFNLIQR